MRRHVLQTAGGGFVIRGSIEIPEQLRRVTVEREGAKGAEWLASLPALVDELLERWSCTPTGDCLSGKVGIIVPAKSAAHGDVVLKVSFPHPANVHEPDAYAAWRGVGAVMLWERDDAKYAMLLEQAGPGRLSDTCSLADPRRTLDEAVAVAGALSRRLAVAAPPGLPRVSDDASGWAELADRAERRLPPDVAGGAAEAVRELCFTQPDTMVHGDWHFLNILRGAREPWLAIDPKGTAGDPAYDAITVFSTIAKYVPGWFDLAGAVRRWVGLFAEGAGLEREHVRRFAHLRAVVRAQRVWERRDARPAVDRVERVAEALG